MMTFFSSDYVKVKRFVRKTGKTTKKAIFKEFSHLSWYEVKKIHSQLKQEGIIADNPDGWYCELMQKLHKDK